MTTLENVHTTIDPYKQLMCRATDEMLKIYSYAPRGFEDLMQGDLSVGNESDMLLRQAALLETGQSTETRLIQSKTSSILTSNARGDASTHIASIVGAQFIKVTGDSISYEFKAQAHRNNNGLSIHTSFDAKYGGSKRLVIPGSYRGLIREESIDEELYSVAAKAVEVLLSMTDLPKIEDNQIEFVKRIRDNDLIPGVNLSSLSDEEIEESLKNLGSNAQSDTMRFIMQRSGLSSYEFAEKLARLTGSVSEFDLSQLSFHFEYDIEIDEETFQSYFEIAEDSEAKSDAAETDASIFTPAVAASINKLVKTDLFGDIIDFDIKDVYEFNDIVKAASGGQTDFEFDVSVEEITDDPDIFEQVLGRFFDGYYFGRDCHYKVRMSMKIDKEAKTLEVSAMLVPYPASGGAGVSNGDEFVVYDGYSQLLCDYVEDNLEDWEEELGRQIDYDDAIERARSKFEDADNFNPANTLVSTAISLEN